MVENQKSPADPAAAFYGLDDEEFSAIVKKLSAHDKRLEILFHNTRKRYQAEN